MKGFKIANLITNIIAFVYAFSFCGLIGGLSILELFFGSFGKDHELITEAIPQIPLVPMSRMFLIYFASAANSSFSGTPCSAQSN